MSKSAPISQNTVQQTQIPGWLTNAAKSAAGASGDLPQYGDPYGNNPYAGLSPDQLQALQVAQGQPGMGLAQSGMPAAYSLANFQAPQQTAGGITGNINAFINPGIQNVIDTTNAQLQRNADISRAGLDTSFAGQGAFGGSRQGVADAELQNQTDMTKAATDAQLYKGNYDTALQAALGLGNANQQAAIQGGQVGVGGLNALTGLAGGLGGLNAQQLAGLLQAGGVQQQTGTNQGLFNYQNWLNQFQIPENILQARAGALGSLPHGTVQQGQMTGTAYSNPLASLMGIGSLLGSGPGSSALSGLGSLGMNALTGIGNAIGSLGIPAGALAGGLVAV